jgi:hypothetical protein
MDLTSGDLLEATRGRLDLPLVKASHGIALREVVQELITAGIQKRDVGLSGGASS